ncbi:Fc receptor-like protein 5 [Pholidichthys leucotaenia]
MATDQATASETAGVAEDHGKAEKTLRPKANIGADSTAFLVGDSVALTCSVKPSTGWRYYWYKGRKLLAPLKRQEFVFHSDGVISVSQEGVYWCRGGRGNPVFYSEYSDSVKINKIDITRPVVTLQPNWSEVYSGEAVTLKCEIPGGDSEWIYEWASTSPNKPPNHNKYRIASVSGLYTGSYWCRGRMRIAREISTNWSAPFNLEMSYASSTPVISVSPSWLSPGVPVTLKCETPNPSAGWKFYWYEAVPQLPSMYFHYRSHQRFWHREHHDQALYKYKLLSGSSSGTEQNLYVIHGQKHTAGFACRAGRGDPGFYTDYSKPLFVWSADFYSPASLSASPNRVQHFTGDSVSLKCEGNFTAWRVKMSPDYRAHFSQRHNLWKITSSTCKIDSHYAHNAVYWCESESGEISNTINITLHNGGVILESPVHPVSEGDSVTLSCKWRPGVIGSTVGFYKNSKLIQNDDRLELNISAVSKSDEGFYKCQYAVYESPESWISVKAYDSSFSVSMIVGMVCGFLLILLLILLLFSWYRKSKHVFCARCSQSQRTTDTVQSINREENQRQLYSSLLHGDVCVYESIRQGENSRIGDPSADYGNVTLQIQLRDVVQKRPSRGLKCQ